MRSFAIGFALIAVGITLGLAVPEIVAQPNAGSSVHKWDQFCEVPVTFKERLEKRVPAWNAGIKAHGQKGYQLVSVAGTPGERRIVFCYRRPAQ